MLVLSEMSILRRLPPGLTAREMVALDAIRQAADTVAMADLRMREVMTVVAAEVRVQQTQITSMFLDAWSIVDAIDRMRSVVKLIVKRRDAAFEQALKDFTDATVPIRDLRNLSDHLFQRVDQIISSRMPAIGRLTWVTMTSTTAARVCVLDPGTVRTKTIGFEFPNVGGRPVRLPSGAVKLRAANQEVWFDEAIEAARIVVEVVESSVEQFAEANGSGRQETPRDFLVCGELSFPEVEIGEVVGHAQQTRLF